MLAFRRKGDTLWHRDRFVCPFIRLYDGTLWKPNVGLTMPFCNIFHLTFKIYSLRQHWRNEAKFFRSRLHLSEFCTFLLTSLLFWQSILEWHKCLNEHPSCIFYELYFFAHILSFRSYICWVSLSTESFMCFLRNFNVWMLFFTSSLNLKRVLNKDI